MAGVTNTIFRRICREFGADVLTSEFVSAEGIFHRNQRTREYLEFDASERPFGVQLFGADPDHIAEAARHVAEWVQPDFLDLNFGCPVNKVVCKNGGSALLKNLPLLQRVASAAVKAVAPLPVTAKIRLGWNYTSINACSAARLLEDSGVQRLAVHGRTKEQGYSGTANWDVIGQVVQAVTIPVIGNGDITCAADAIRRRREAGVYGVMIGRAAMSNPWIFGEIRATRDSHAFHSPSLEERWLLAVEHCRRETNRQGSEPAAIRSMRSRLMTYTRMMPGSRRLRERLASVQSIAEIEDIAATHLRLHSLGDVGAAGQLCAADESPPPLWTSASVQV